LPAAASQPLSPHASRLRQPPHYITGTPLRQLRHGGHTC